MATSHAPANASSSRRTNTLNQLLLGQQQKDAKKSTEEPPTTYLLKAPTSPTGTELAAERTDSSDFEGLTVPSIAPSPLGGNWFAGFTSTSSCMGHTPTFPVVPEAAAEGEGLQPDAQTDEDAALTDDEASVGTSGSTAGTPTAPLPSAVSGRHYDPYQLPIFAEPIPFSREPTTSSLAPQPIDDETQGQEEGEDFIGEAPQQEEGLPETAGEVLPQPTEPQRPEEAETPFYETIHGSALQGFLGFLPYPENVVFEEPPEHIPPRSQAPYQNRVFLGHLWVKLGTSVVQWLIDSFAFPIGCGHIAHLCAAQRHVNKSGYYAGCAHAALCCEQPADTEWVMKRLHKRALFDLSGVWYAETPEQQEHLLRYCDWLCRLPQHDRHMFLQSLPCNPIAVEFAQNVRTVNPVPPPYANHKRSQEPSQEGH